MMNVDNYTLDFLYDIWLGDSDYCLDEYVRVEFDQQERIDYWSDLIFNAYEASVEEDIDDLDDFFSYVGFEDSFYDDTYECGCCTCCGCNCYEQDQMDDLDELAHYLYNETDRDILIEHNFCNSYFKLVNIYNKEYVNDLIFCEMADGFNM